MNSASPNNAGGAVQDFGARWIPLIRAGGYVLLLLSLADLIESMFPISLMDPGWEMNFMGALIERSPVPLIGLLLVFYGDIYYRTKRALLLAGGLSWLSLALGIGFLLTIPLITTNTIRISKRAQAGMEAQLQQQMTQAGRFEKEFRAAQEENVLQLYQRIQRSPEGKDAESMRGEILGELDRYREGLQAQAERTLRTQRMNLTKRSLKWGVQALFVGVVLIFIWRGTGWARVRVRVR